MMPSRGLPALRGIVPRITQAQTRSFSIARASPVRSTLRRTRNSSQPLTTTAILASARSIRYNSTDSGLLADPPTGNLPNIDTITLDQIDFGSAGISATEKLGYLREIGLDYGWGPTSVIEWTLEHIHIVGGLPWWGSIMATAIFFRLLNVPLFIKAADVNARQIAMSEVIKPITDSMQAAQRAGDKAKQQQEMLRLFAVRKAAGIKLSDTFKPILLQGVIGFCGFKLISAMSTLPVPGLQTGGILWFSDLTLTDGYLIIPTILAGVIHLTIRAGGETGVQMLRDGWLKYALLYGMPAAAWLLTAWQSTALALWFLTTTSFSLIQGAFLRQRVIRELLGISPLIKVKPGQTPAMGGLQDILERMQQTPNPKEKTTWQSPSFAKPTSKVIDTKLVNKENKKAFSTIAARRTSESAEKRFTELAGQLGRITSIPREGSDASSRSGSAKKRFTALELEGRLEDSTHVPVQGSDVSSQSGSSAVSYEQMSSSVRQVLGEMADMTPSNRLDGALRLEREHTQALIHRLQARLEHLDSRLRDVDSVTGFEVDEQKMYRWIALLQGLDLWPMGKIKHEKYLRWKRYEAATSEAANREEEEEARESGSHETDTSKAIKKEDDEAWVSESHETDTPKVAKKEEGEAWHEADTSKAAKKEEEDVWEWGSHETDTSKATKKKDDEAWKDLLS